MSPGNKVKLRYGLCGAAVLIALLVLFAMLGGCAVGRELESGHPMVGLQLGDPAVVQAASSIGGVVGGIFGGPAGAATGASLAGAVATAFWGIRRGERKGWDEAVESVKGKPAVAPTVVVDGGSASRVGPVAGGAA